MLRADHIFISKIVSNYGLEPPQEDDFEKINKLFYKKKGSWEKIFLGSCDDIKILKKSIKEHYKK